MIMSREEYVTATVRRATTALRETLRDKDDLANYWLFVGLEANRRLVQDLEPRPAAVQEPPYYHEDSSEELDCVDMSNLRRGLRVYGKRIPPGVLE